MNRDYQIGPEEVYQMKHSHEPNILIAFALVASIFALTIGFAVIL